MSIRIKDWAKFQHFKDRRPPWIKLYRDILDDPEWFALDPEASKALVMLWLIASETDGYLPDIKKISFRLRISDEKAKSLILALSHWLEHDDITVISPRYQDDAPEGETERETEKEREGEDGVPPALPQIGKKGSRFPDGACLTVEQRDFASREGIADPDREWAKFGDYWRSQPGAKGVKLDWPATWRNWVRRSSEDSKPRHQSNSYAAGML
ncbi:hypothetical protein CU669_15155 [Paramagnetospirillum kuznetsovii]|uniref:DnaT DNA-binding domain-containing protein n=1 Tax=Paramagnetospirillum kuznetsovii TaxID=2053833 RepID=A0A364NVS2_9PROT|nr:hypothetical protein [Paramagnetospirillum kuznetsovii]RAU21090.1 hypothetical protein CU669_15155 [Paramagnetospirillum kuznetsovii]